MSECKVQIDPIEFGKLDQKTEDSHKRIDGLDAKLDQIDGKIDKMKLWILGGFLASPVANDIVPSGKDVLLALADGFVTIIGIANAYF